MAQRVVVQLDCDVDGKSGSDVETVSFGYEGTSYELELCGKHRKSLDAVLNELVASARKVVGASRGRTVAKTSLTTGEPAGRERGDPRLGCCQWYQS